MGAKNDEIKKEFSKTQIFLRRAMGLIGVLFFGGFLVYGVLVGQFSWIQMMPLTIVLILIYLFRNRLKEYEKTHTPSFVYKHFYLLLLTAFLLGVVLIGVLRAI